MGVDRCVVDEVFFVVEVGCDGVEDLVGGGCYFGIDVVVW